MVVEDGGSNFSSNFATLNFRGTANSWGTQAMALVADIAADPVRSLRGDRGATPRARRRDPPGAHWGQSAPPPHRGGRAVAPWEGRPGPPGDTGARPAGPPYFAFFFFFVLSLIHPFNKYSSASVD